jgi:arabinogalactan oligomer/maltooligosaccharide transport system substrate-binding protein
MATFTAPSMRHPTHPLRGRTRPDTPTGTAVGTAPAITNDFLEEINTRMSNSKMRLAALFAGAAIFAAACGGTAATTAPTTAPTTAASPEAPSAEAPSSSGTATESTAPAGEPLSGELTLWHSYGSGGGETGAFQQALGQLLVTNKDLKVNVVEQPFADIFTKWQTDVLAGGGPDLYIAPNDNLFSQADAGALANLTDALNGKLEGFNQVAIDGSKADIGDGKGPQFYMVPESLKAVAMWYDSAKVATPPASTDDLLTAVKGGLTLGLNQNAYHMFGLTGAFGGTLMDDSGKCVADQAGFADAFKYFQDLKAAGAKFYTDGNALKQDYQTGKLQAVIDGPWQTADFTKAIPGSKVANIPAGTAPANPFTGTDGWYINPNGKNIDLATAFALQMVGTTQEQVMTSNAGHVPAAPGVTIDNPTVQAFSDAASAGLARPQRKEFNNYWGPFGDAINKVLDKNADATQAVADACKAMNDANGM